MGTCWSEVFTEDDGVVKMTAPRQEFAKAIRSLLLVALPECATMAESDEGAIFSYIIHALDEVAKRHLDDLSDDQRIHLLLKCVPTTVGACQRFMNALKEFKGRKKLRRGHKASDIITVIKIWFDADKDNTGVMSLESLNDVILRLNLALAPTVFRQLVDRISTTNGVSEIHFREFYFLYQVLTTVHVVAELYDAIRTRQSPEPTFYDLGRFLRASQYEDFRPEETLKRVQSFFGDVRMLDDGEIGVGYRPFQSSILDTVRNGWRNPLENTVHQDMTQPLHHYFINSSHNTYLSGRQVADVADVNMYRVALLAGCRCVEIDCWDKDGEPSVQHSHVTTGVTFVDVIRAIHETAFRNSLYPVVLSLEMHSSFAVQGKIARIMRAIFGSSLLTAADADATTASCFGFSPAGLMRKILVKMSRKTKKKDYALHPELVDLAFINSRSHGSAAEMMKFKHYDVSSFSEDEITAWCRDPDSWMQVNKCCLTRIYPKANITSGNYDPQPFWDMGSQMVALNIQTPDVHMLLNNAKFSSNGGCGYILKPRCLRIKDVPGGSFADCKVLSVTVLSAFRLPLRDGTSTLDPRVEVFITGYGRDDTRKSPQTTHAVKGNGLNPEWKSTFMFHLNAVEMALLTLRVMSGTETVGENTIPVAAIHLGFRAVPLQLARQVLPPPTCLFCLFDLKSAQRRVDERDL